MSEIRKEVTPLTTGIIWLTKNEVTPQNSYYEDVDYLLDGLLTANLRAANGVSSRVIVGKNFGRSLYVMIVNELKAAELESYLSLFKNDLTTENDLLVIDETEGFENLRKQVGKLSSHLRIIQ